MRNHVSKTLGSTGALIYMEIRRCMSLRGGRIIDGSKWIWKTAQELADLFGFNERTVRRHLKRIVELGWLKREKHEAKDYDQTYWYTFGDEDPLTDAKKCPVGAGQVARPKAVNAPASSFVPGKNIQEERHCVPTAEATAELLASRWDGMTFTVPPWTHATRPEFVGVEHGLKLAGFQGRAVSNANPGNSAGVPLANSDLNRAAGQSINRGHSSVSHSGCSPSR